MTQAKPTTVAPAKAEHRDIRCRTWGHEGSSETLGAQERILSGREYPWKGLSHSGWHKGRTEPPPRNRGTPLSNRDWQSSNHTVRFPHPISDCIYVAGDGVGQAGNAVTGVVDSHPPEVRAHTEARAAELRGIDDVDDV